jgi:hypothetical protein
MNDKLETQEAQPKTSAETLEILRQKAKAARAESDRLWATMKEIEELRRKYDVAVHEWHTAFQKTEQLEAAVKLMEETR